MTRENQLREAPPLKFTADWVSNTLDLRRKGDRPVPPEGLERIAAETNKTNLRENIVAVNDWPHFLRLPPDARERIRRAEPPTPHDDERRWAGWVLSLAETVLTEVKQANPGKREDYYGFTPDGPVVRFMLGAIKEISGEKPTGDAVAKELERRRRSEK